MSGAPQQRNTSPSILKDRELLRRVVASARPYRGRITLLLGLVVVSTVLPLTQPLLLRTLIDDLAAGHGMNALVIPLILIGVVGIGAVLAEFASARTADAIGHSVTSDLQRRLFDHLSGLPMSFYTTVRSGTLTSRLTNDVYAVEPLFTTVIASALASTVTLAAAGIVLIAVDIRLAAVLIIVPLVLWPVRKAESKINTVIRSSFRNNSELSSHVEAVLNRDGVLLARQSGAMETERAKFGELAGKVRDTALRLAAWRAAVGASYDMVFTLATTALLTGGALLVTGGDISLGTLILFLLYLRQIQGPVSTLIGLRYPSMRAGAAFTRVFDVLDSSVRPIPDPVAAERKATVHEGPVLGFDNVSFEHLPTDEIGIPGLSHSTAVSGPGMFGLTAAPHEMDHSADAPADKGSRVLNGVDLTVASGETVAIVGSSGAGKSTIALLAAGLLRPTEGIVRVKGHDTTELSQRELSQAVALITQETHVRHDTIQANLRYVRPEASDEELVEACRAAQLHTLIESLPDGYETVIGEKGYRFSGGERQRLSIARALVKQAELIVLDEPTSQLDAGTEELLNAALVEVFADRAVLVMAHRLRTVRDADRILVLHNGTFRESGTHGELLAVPDGHYASLYRTQVES